MKKLKIRKAFAPGDWGDRNPILGVCLPLYLLPVDEVIKCPHPDPVCVCGGGGRCCVLKGQNSCGVTPWSLSLPDSRLGKGAAPLPIPGWVQGLDPGLGMQPGNLAGVMVGLASELSLQLHRSSSPGNCWLSDLCKMPVSSSERGQGSGDEGEGLFVAIIPSCCLPRRRKGGGPPALLPLAAHQHAVPAALRGSLLALCLQGYGQGGFGREAERVLARPHQAPLGNRVQAEIQASPKLPVCVCVAPISVLPSEGPHFLWKPHVPFKHRPCAGPPGPAVQW